MLGHQLENTHVSYLSKSSCINLHKIGHIQLIINEEALSTHVHAFISLKLNSLNSLIMGVPKCVLRKLQMIRNNALRNVLGKTKCKHITHKYDQVSSLIQNDAMFKNNMLLRSR